MTRQEFKEWRDTALNKPIRDKSKTITKKPKDKEEEETKQRVEQIKVNVDRMNLATIDE